MCVNVYRGLDVGVTHEFLGDPDIHSSFGEVGAERVAETVRNEIISQYVLYDLVPIGLGSHLNIHSSVQSIRETPV